MISDSLTCVYDRAIYQYIKCSIIMRYVGRNRVLSKSGQFKSWTQARGK